MAEELRFGDPPITVTLRRSARARRLSLRISAADGRVSLTLPARARLQEGLDFLHSREDWLRRHLSKRPETVRPAWGMELPLEGVMLRVEPGEGARVEVAGGSLRVPGPEERVAARLRGFLQARARDVLSAASDRHAATLGVRFSRISLRDTRSRWGSCTSEGRLMYSWRLVMAPPEVADYVAAHEVAHLVEMNHSPAFWQLVARLCPGHARHRAWLRTLGPGLHRYVL